MPLKARLSTEATKATNDDENEVLFNSDASVRYITLNRPKKLNSLNSTMIQKITPRLLEWAKSPTANIIILKGNGRALCAGGDVAALTLLNQKGQHLEASKYFSEEYAIDFLIAAYNKPFVSYMNGIVMGGGVGLSVHAPFRIATENTRIAMPETDIGLFPDVGASFFLSRLDGELGTYLALTAQDLRGFDALTAGFATHFVPAARLDALSERLATLGKTGDSESLDFYGKVNAAIEDFVEPLPSDYQFHLNNEERNIIDSCFKEHSIEKIITNLKNNGSKFALNVLERLKVKSPTSLKVTLALLRRGKELDLYTAFNYELYAGYHFNINHDFNEGVTAKLLTKPSRKANWEPSNILDVDQKIVNSYLTKHPDFTLPDIEKYPGLCYTYENYPYNMGLPTELEISNFITGNDGSNRKYSVTKQEVIKEFTQKYKNKIGVKWKVENVIERKCKESEFEKDYLQWFD